MEIWDTDCTDEIVLEMAPCDYNEEGIKKDDVLEETKRAQVGKERKWEVSVEK